MDGGEVIQQFRALTPKERDFVRLYVANGGNGAAAARLAYPDNVRPDAWAYQLVRKPPVAAAIRAEQISVLMSQGASTAVATLLSLAGDKGVAPRDRIAASRALLDAARLSGRSSDDQGDRPKALGDMSLSDIEARIKALSADLADITPTAQLEGVAVDMTPNEAPNTAGDPDTTA